MKFLVVGSGLAGITATERILESGNEVKVVSKLNQPSSTGIATGMYNPIVFRRISKSWMIDDLLPVMHQFYSGISSNLNIELDRKISFFKKVPNEDYEKWWNEKLLDAEFESYIGTIENGLAPVFKAGIIDCESLKTKYESWLSNKGLLLNETFNFAQFELSENTSIYKGETFDKVIFCDGPYAAQNPFFDWLPFNLCQGEWIIIKTENEIESDVINAKTNVIPLGNCHYKLSSTYSWKTLDWNPSETAKSELIENFEKLYPVSYEIVEHIAALRPTVADRRPYLGAHPEHKQIFIFNGLGSKGVMLAPYFSKELIDHILFGKDLMDEVNISRHFKRYYNRDDK